jgi:hypothetical protein
VFVHSLVDYRIGSDCRSQVLTPPDVIGRFAYTGTRDYTPFACVPAALTQFVNDPDIVGGLHAMRRYNHSLCISAAHLLSDIWGTYLLVGELAMRLYRKLHDP